jgi:3-oxoacyl-[acyl-carrier protein] reductase
VAIVTGGTRGIGQAIVRRLAGRGYDVVVNYVHDQRAAESTIDAVLADNGVAVAVRADVADALDVERLFAETATMFVGVDVVVHTVASPITECRVAHVDLDLFDEQVRLNTRAALIVNRAAARHVRAGGAIVNLASAARGSALPAYGAYTATRAAVDVLTRTLAVDLAGRDVTVNAVSLEVDRPCMPGRAADVVAYLLTDEGHRLTGHVFRIDGPEPTSHKADPGPASHSPGSAS